MQLGIRPRLSVAKPRPQANNEESRKVVRNGKSG